MLDTSLILAWIAKLIVDAVEDHDDDDDGAAFKAREPWYSYFRPKISQMMQIGSFFFFFLYFILWCWKWAT